MIAKWNDKEFNLLNSIEISKSSREVSFSNIEIDFEGKTKEDIPVYLQEVKILNEDNTLKYTGYVNRCELPKLRLNNSIDRSLSIELLSPRALTTKKTVTVVMTGKIKDVLDRILSPLYEDGFAINDYHIEDRAITVKFISKTIEECLNILSNKLGIYWNIDELKKIQICDISYLFNKEPIEINTENCIEEIKGLEYLLPTIEGYDYANIINVKNARVFITETLNESFTLKQNDTYTFPHPIDISLETARRVLADSGLFGDQAINYIDNLSIEFGDFDYARIMSNFNKNGAVGIDDQEIVKISTEDKDNQIFTLQMDNTFKNLATGITYKGEGTVTITRIRTQTALQYSNMKLFNWHEIDTKKGIITPSGQVERTIDAQEKWFTVQELIDYIRNQFTINDNYVNSIQLVFDEENEFEIGDRFEINIPELFTEGNFIITNINETIKNAIDAEYVIELRNTNILENYIDLFRSSETEEQESQIEVEYVVEHAEEETIREKHYIEVEADKSVSTLNFELR